MLGLKGLLRGGPLSCWIEKALGDLSSEEGRSLDRKCGLQKGDVVGVSRGVFEHYGIYVSKESVIHYSCDSTDIVNNTVIETTFAAFLRGATEYFVLVFPDEHGQPHRVNFETSAIVSSVWSDIDRLHNFIKRTNYQLYSAEETVRRARSRLGEDRYSLSVNNCEHFAIWCKTGVSESYQIEELKEALDRAVIH